MKASPFLLALPLALAVMIAACGGDSTKPDEPGSVTGTITDIDSGLPVTDAAVAVVDPASMATRSYLVAVDATGRFKVTGLARGRYSVFVYHRNRVIFDREAPYVQIESGKNVAYDMRVVDPELWEGNMAMHGTVRDADSGKLIAGAYVGDVLSGIFGAQEIWASLSGVALPYWGITDSAGRFSIDLSIATDEGGNELGVIPLSASKSGYAPNTLVGSGPSGPPGLPPLLPLPAEGDTSVTVEIFLHKLPSGGLPAGTTGAIRGRVLFIEQPVPDLGVAAAFGWRNDPDTLHANRSPAVPLPGAIARTNASGRFVIAVLVPGMYSVAPGYLPDDGYVPGFSVSDNASEISITAGDTTDVGDIHVLRAMFALSPADGASITETTPALSWTAPVLDAAHVIDHYVVWWSDGYIQDDETTVVGTTWQVPDSLAFTRGGHYRWDVEAYATGSGGEGDPFRVATFEWPVTFTVK